MVITTIMEHHSNDLPHRKHFREVVRIPAAMAAHSLGCVNLRLLEQALREHADKVNHVAITGVSNVNGIINPIHEIAEMAHRYGALIVVDAAQMAAHVPVREKRANAGMIKIRHQHFEICVLRYSHHPHARAQSRRKLHSGGRWLPEF